MIPRLSLGVVAVIPLVLIACRTVPVPAPYVIDIPAGMTQQQVEVAIVAGILNTHPPAGRPRLLFTTLDWVGCVIRIWNYL